MPTTPRPRSTWRLVARVSAVLAFTLTAIMIASGWAGVMVGIDTRTWFSVGAGTCQLGYAHPRSAWAVSGQGFHADTWSDFALHWWPALNAWGGGWEVSVPLWMPATALALLALAAARLARRSPLTPLPCPTCGYDRTGLDASAICPECGKRIPS